MRRSPAGQSTSSVVAVVSAAIVVAALVAFVFQGTGGGNPPAAVDQPAAADAISRTKDRSADPDQPAAAERTPEPKAQQEPKTQRKAEPRPADAVPDVYVEVYNMTAVSGLAGAKAAELQDAGWQVVGIDNWRGDIPASTVYYPDGMADAAGQLAATLGIGRTRGAVAPMRFDRLTVILAADAT